MNEVRQDLYTQSEYAKKLGVSRQYINKLVREGSLKIVKVNGTTLIKEG